MAGSKRYFFTLNSKKPREKLVIDFIENSIDPAAYIKNILYRVATGEYGIREFEAKKEVEHTHGEDRKKEKITVDELEQLNSFLQGGD